MLDNLIFRIIEACGNSGFLTGSFSMIAKEFPENVATMFAILETFFGIGMIVGPTVGGALYEAGGFTLPFVSLGIVMNEVYNFLVSDEFLPIPQAASCFSPQFSQLAFCPTHGRSSTRRRRSRPLSEP